jgi:hypothetical protein
VEEGDPGSGGADGQGAERSLVGSRGHDPEPTRRPALDDPGVALPTYAVRVQHGVVRIGAPSPTVERPRVVASSPSKGHVWWGDARREAERNRLTPRSMVGSFTVLINTVAYACRALARAPSAAASDSPTPRGAGLTE